MLCGLPESLGFLMSSGKRGVWENRLFVLVEQKEWREGREQNKSKQLGMGGPPCFVRLQATGEKSLKDIQLGHLSPEISLPSER